MRFATAAFERYCRRETSIEEAMTEIYLVDVSARRIENVPGILRGSSVLASTVFNLNEKAFAAIGKRRFERLVCAYPYAFIDGAHMKRSWGGSHGNVMVMVAIGVNDDGCRKAIGAAEVLTESKECWHDHLMTVRVRPAERACSRAASQR